MGIVFWLCAISVVCIIASVTFYKPYLGIAFVIIAIPFEGSEILDCISIYPLEVILAISVLICIYKSIVRRYNYFGNTKLVYCCIPFILCIIFSAMKSIELSLTVKEIVRWLELFLIYYLTINLINDEKKMRVVLYSIFLTVAMVSILGIISHIKGARAISLFGNPNPLAGYVNLIIPVLFGMLIASVCLWERIMLSVITALSIVTWFVTFSRSAWLSLIIIMIPFFIFNKVRRRAIFISLIIFSIFVVIVLSTDMDSILMSISKVPRILQSIQSRFECYPIGFDIVKGDLIFGIGIGNYSLLITKFTTEMILTQSHLHSLYLQVFVETGIMGLSAFAFWLVCIVKYLVSSWKVLEKTGSYSLFVGLVGGVIVYLINNLADVLVVHGIHLQWGIILGLAMVLTQFRESETCPKAV
jgi:O-antigen ligase